MQNGTSVASPLPAFPRKKGKNIIIARTVARRVLGRAADSGIVKGAHRWDPSSLRYCFCIILLNVAAERGASGR